MNVGAQKKRLMVMIAVNVAAVLLGIAALVGNLGYGVGWMLPAFVACLAAALAAQLWFIVGFARAGRAQ